MAQRSDATPALPLLAATREEAPTKGLLPIVLGAGLFLVHVVVSLGTAVDGSGLDAALLGSALLGLVLVLYGAVNVGLALGAERQAARDLPRTRSQLEGLIDASPLAITAGDLEGRLTLWNRAAEQIFGWPADEVIGQVYPAVPEGRTAEWWKVRDRVLAGETVYGLETQRCARDGRMIDVSVSAAPVRDGRGEIVGTVAVVADLSRSRDAAREVERLESQLQRAQRLESVGRLTAGIAHDFNNLLTAIGGHAELILGWEDTPDQVRDDLAEISRSTERAAALTRQLLTFSHRGPVEARPLDVNATVNGMQSLLQRLIGETIDLHFEPAVDVGAVLIDPGQLEQVIMNLVINARDALPGGGQIVIGTRAVDVDEVEAESFPYEVWPGPYAVVVVRDTGLGMDQGTADRIFEPFFTTKPIGVGTGLGLSTVYSIVKQARGHIRVETEPGSGTTFRVFLPRHEGEHVATPVAPRVTASDNGSGSETILVAEDERAVLTMAERALERQGYKVLPAGSGRDALRLALKHPGEIHLLFCDVVMPDLTGREVAERIMDVRPGIRVLMTSGYGERQLAGEGLPADAEFLPKPYTPAELTTRVRALLGEPAWH